jgi:hypothetical protein
MIDPGKTHQLEKAGRRPVKQVRLSSGRGLAVANDVRGDVVIETVKFTGVYG